MTQKQLELAEDVASASAVYLSEVLDEILQSPATKHRRLVDHFQTAILAFFDGQEQGWGTVPEPSVN